VKVPVGKHCGFVQFVRKADAERAIEKMQGFPIGGSRIRLSWGRSQCKSIINLCMNNCPKAPNVDKAAQAAAQAAQAAALQAHLQSQMVSSRGTPISMEQTVQLLQQMQLAGFLNPIASGDVQGQQDQSQLQSTAPLNDESLRNVVFSTRDANGTSPFGVQPCGGFGDMRTPRAGLSTSFSPFSPDPNLFSGGDLTSGPLSKRPEGLMHYSVSAADYAQGFGSAPALPHDVSNTMGADGKLTVPHFPTFYENPIPVSFSRPPSGSLNTSQERQEYFEMPEHEPDAITDLNGTLASLDLDSVHHHQSPSSSSASAHTTAAWKTPSSSSPSA
jgi:RNA recognition motif. (a.k.a. RRM, RBD, or RNP domain)